MALFCVLPMFFQKILCMMALCVTAVVFSGCLFFGFGFAFVCCFLFYHILQPTVSNAGTYVQWHFSNQLGVRAQGQWKVCFQFEWPVSSTGITGLTEELLRGFPCPIHRGVPLVKVWINCQNQAKWGLEWPLNKKTLSLWEWVLSVVNKSHRIKPVDSEK